MVISISALAEPVGSIKSWIRPDASTSLPSGWVICDGSLVVDVSSPFNGNNVPDLRGRFPRGHATLDNSNFPADAGYFTGGSIPVAGVDSNNFFHGHNNPGHVHPAGTHQHTVSVNQHHHNIPSSTFTGFVSQTTGSTPFSSGIIGPGPGPAGHNHSLATFAVTQSTAQGSTAGTASGTTQSAGITINGNLGFVDNRPAYTELVLIIKIK